MLELYKNIRNRRIQLGMTQDELAEKVGYSGKSMIARIEKGDIDLQVPKIISIAKALNIDPNDLMGWNNEPPAENIHVLDAYAVPILGKIACGNGSFLEDCFNGEFIVDRSIKADYCLIASGDSMIDVGIEDGDRVLLKKAEDFHDGSIYGVIIMGEDIATLKKVYRTDSGYLLQPCNASGDYRPMFVNEEEVCFAGECVGVYKSI